MKHPLRDLYGDLHRTYRKRVLELEEAERCGLEVWLLGREDLSSWDRSHRSDVGRELHRLLDRLAKVEEMLSVQNRFEP